MHYILASDSSNRSQPLFLHQEESPRIVKARKKVQIKDPKVVQMKNGRYAIKGTSSETGITVMRICGSDKAKAQALI